MRTILSNPGPTSWQAQVDDSGLKTAARTTETGEAAVASAAKGMTLDEAQRLALTNDRLFEAGVSMAVLDRPGTVGKVFDTYASRLADVLVPVLAGGGAGARAVHFNGAQQCLADVLKDAMLAPMADPASGRIGRKMTEDVERAAWIVAQLETPLMSPSGEYASGQDVTRLLTKVEAVCGFGTTVRQLMNQPDAMKRAQNEDVLREAMKPLGEGIASQFGARFDTFKDVMRAPRLDDRGSPTRSERRPWDVQDGPTPVECGSAQEHGQRIGHVTARDAGPIGAGSAGSPSRPFMMTTDELRLALDGPLMETYQDLLFSAWRSADQTFREALDVHTCSCGAGVERWPSAHAFTRESKLRGLPSDGARSGGTRDALLAFNTLSDGPLYDRVDIVEPATLGIAAFMNVGGYHPFAETVPVGMAMANGGDFEAASGGLFSGAGRFVEDVARLSPLSRAIDAPWDPLAADAMRAGFLDAVGADLQRESLYQRVAGMAANYTNATGDVLAIHDAYEQNHSALCGAHPELLRMEAAGVRSVRVDIDRLA